jgi:hypothetical protein
MPAATLTPHRPRRTPATRSTHRVSSLGGVQTDQSRASIEAASANGPSRADRTPCSEWSASEQSIESCPPRDCRRLSRGQAAMASAQTARACQCVGRPRCRVAENAHAPGRCTQTLRARSQSRCAQCRGAGAASGWRVRRRRADSFKRARRSLPLGMRRHKLAQPALRACIIHLQRRDDRAADVSLAVQALSTVFSVDVLSGVDGATGRSRRGRLAALCSHDGK